MKNHFYICYFGNKRQEIEEIYNNLNLDNIDTIIEPYCGSQSMSYFISTKKPNLKYIFNDNNEYLREMYEIMTDIDKTQNFNKKIQELLIEIDNDKINYLKLIKEQNVYSWFIKSKYYRIHPGMFPTDCKWLYKNIETYPIYDFYNENKHNITFTSIEGIECYEKYKQDNKKLLLLDPPYMNANNDFYLKKHGINIYEYLYNNPIENELSNVMLILEGIWIIKLLFQNSKIVSYDKTYSTGLKKQTKHLLIKNF
jgi:hypothetical protein